MLKSGDSLAASLADLTLGNSVVAIGWLRRRTTGSRLRGASSRVRLLRELASLPRNYSGPRKGARVVAAPPGAAPPVEDSYLVDSASSHMLVSKIKPCMSKYKQLYGETANGSLNQLSFI